MIFLYIDIFQYYIINVNTHTKHINYKEIEKNSYFV